MGDSYRVIKQEETMARLDDGSFGRVVRITFRTTRGVIGSVDVPVDRYNIDNARAAIEERAEHLDAVADL